MHPARALCLALIGGLVALSSGCATITGSVTQSIDIVAHDQRDRPVAGMDCALKNDAGEYSAATPAVEVVVRRSSSELEIECRRGPLVARATVVPRADSAVAHAFIPLGSVATLIDYATGAMYTYPSPLKLRIGQHLRYEMSTEARASVVATVGDAQLAEAAAFKSATAQPLPGERIETSEPRAQPVRSATPRPARPSTPPAHIPAASSTGIEPRKNAPLTW